MAPSFGGIYVRLYQLEHPDQVNGFVLIDPTTEDRLFTMIKGAAIAIAELSADQLRTTMPASGSFPMPKRSPQKGAPFDRLPAELYQLRIKFDQRLIDGAGATILAEQIRESSEGQREALARLLTSRKAEKNPFNEVPVVVLTRGRDMSDGLAENHAGLAKLARNSRHTVVADSGHEVHLFTPAAVIQAIQDVSTAIRQRQSTAAALSRRAFDTVAAAPRNACAKRSLWLPISASVTFLMRACRDGFDRLAEESWRFPNEARVGRESNAVAQRRGLTALMSLLDRHRGQHLVVSTHGTLMALIMNGLDSSLGFRVLVRPVVS